MASYFSQQTIKLSSPAINTYQESQWNGDINNDGVVDFILQNKAAITNGNTTLRIQTSSPTGYAETKLFLNGSEFTVQNPEVLIADFTGDGTNDLAIFDAGIYDWGVRLNLGLTPQLFVGNGKGDFIASSQFIDAISKKIVPIPSNGNLGGVQTDTTIGIKDVAFADINRDGLIDIWVECTGSKNMTSHFLMNRGSYFEVDINNRIDKVLFFGPLTTDYFRYGMGELLDVNGDTFPDLFLGQIRDNHITHINQTSLLLINDGNGYYPSSKAIKLTTPNFYYGYTSVQGVDSFDINRDGLKDLVILHTRNDDVSGPLVEKAWTGSFYQIFIQTSDGQFIDRTLTYFPDQSAWSTTSNQSAKGISHADLNADGWNDLIIDYAGIKNNTQLPQYFLNNKGAQFLVGDASLLYGTISPAVNLKSLNANSDSYLDFYRSQTNTDGSGSIVLLLGNESLGVAVPAFINGSIFNDVLKGGALNETFYGNEGKDYVDGGSGTDTVRFDGAQVQFIVSKTGEGLVVADQKGSNGTDTLTNIERLQFADATIAFDIGANQIAGSGYMLYKAAFNRTPDAGGLGFWINKMDTGMSYSSVAQNFVNSAEFKTAFGGANPTVNTLVTKLYNNVLNRTPDAGGLAFWQGKLSNEGWTTADVLGFFSTSGENVTNVTPLIANGIQYQQFVG